MLFLMVHLGDDRYVLNTGQIKEILPMVHLKRVSQMPPAVAGVFNYRGTPVPVVDLAELTLGRPAQNHLSTRLVLASFADANGDTHHLGMIAERATDTIRLNPMDFGPCGIANGELAYLGPVTADAHGVIQWLDPARILPPLLQMQLPADPSGP